MSEKMTQEEIDALIGNLSSVEEARIDNSHAVRIKNKYKAVNTAKKRYEFALLNSSFDAVKEARQYLHHAAFDLWLANRNMTRKEYYDLVNREIKRRFISLKKHFPEKTLDKIAGIAYSISIWG